MTSNGFDNWFCVNVMVQLLETFTILIKTLSRCWKFKTFFLTSTTAITRNAIKTTSSFIHSQQGTSFSLLLHFIDRHSLLSLLNFYIVRCLSTIKKAHHKKHGSRIVREWRETLYGKMYWNFCGNHSTLALIPHKNVLRVQHNSTWTILSILCSQFFHSFFEFVFTVLLSAAIDVSFVGRGVPLLSNEFVEWTDCISVGDWGWLPCDAASAICKPMIFELACLKWSLNFNCTTLMHMDVSARPKMR